jgi:Secretion system C-terminal sorting domain
MKNALFFLSLLLISQTTHAKTWHVNQSIITFPQNGYYWKTALKSFKQALDSSAAGDTIKVAEGLYIPGTTSTSIFNIKNKVVILGGYSAVDSLIARNFSIYKTILSGKYSLTSRVVTVVRIAGCDASTQLDGFIIEDGFDNPSSDGGAGAKIIFSSEIRISNCVFRNNYSSFYGGAVSILQNSKPIFTNCYFQNNESFHSGAVYINLSNGAKFINCVFVDNQGQQTGTVIRAAASATTIINCTIFRNKIIGYDGNTGMDTTAMIYALSNSVISIHNSILFSNTYTAYNGSQSRYSYESPDVFSTNSSIIFSNSISQNQTTGSNLLISVNPRFKDTANIIGQDNRYFTADDGLILTAPCSPALNSGDNSYVSGILTDITGNPRIYNSGITDMGAYEYQYSQGTSIKTVYVNKLATGSSNGSNWSNAYKDLQLALLSCADTIKVAAGDYWPSVSNPYSSFWLRNKVIILGGYPTGGNPTDEQRNPAVNLTKLNGQIPNSGGIRSKRILYAKNVDSTCIVDGIQIVNAKNDYYEMETGALRITNASNPLFFNISISGNDADFYGSGLTIDKGSSPFFSNSNIVDNNRVCVFVQRKSKAEFVKCNFSSNGSPSTGGAVFADSVQLNFDSCVFKSNNGALNLTSVYNTNIKNCTFIGNYSGNGSSVYQKFGTINYYNCTFKDTINNILGGSIYAEQTTANIVKCLFNASRSDRGGAIYNFKSKIFCSGVVFHKTYGKIGGGAVFNTDSAEAKFINCSFNENEAQIFGSCIFNNRSNTDLTNCTLVSNIASRYTSNDTSCVIYNVDSSFSQIKNTIFWGNEPGLRENISPYFNDIVNRTGATRPSAAVLYNSVTQIYGVNGVNSNLVGVNPRFFDYFDADGIDNVFFTSDDGIALSPCSPMLNKGDNSFINGVSTDILNNPRLFNSTVDIGAYEYQNSLNPRNVFYVNPLANGLNDGTSWANAYTSLHKALKNFCADTLKVAQGIYKTSLIARDSFFTVKLGTVILGGYPNAGNPTDQMRSPLLYPTVLDANCGNINDSTDNNYHVVSFPYTEGKALIDGFVIKNGYAYGGSNSYYSFGGGVFVLNSDVTVKDCIIEKNVAINGGGVSFGLSRFHIDKTIIQNNYSFLTGGGMEITFSNGIFSNSVVSSNYCENRGGGLYTYTPSMDIVNVVFNRNKTQYGGGGAYNEYPFDIKYINCTFFRNHTTSAIKYGGGIFVQQGGEAHKAKLYNCIFRDNRWGFIGNPSLLWSDGYYTYNSTIEDFTELIYNTAVQTIGNTNNAIGGEIVFSDTSNAPGPDGVWRTNDDGLKTLFCSAGVNGGLNSIVSNIVTDIKGSLRIQNGIVDLGPYEHNGINDCFPTAIPNLEILRNVKIFPNPTSAIVIVNINEQINGSVVIKIYDNNGRLVKNDNHIFWGNQFRKLINLGELPSGIYMIELITKKGNLKTKISVLK